MNANKIAKKKSQTHQKKGTKKKTKKMDHKKI